MPAPPRSVVAVAALVTLAGAAQVPLVATALAAGRAGRLARLEAPAPTRSWVAPGRFVMGTPPEDLETLEAECQRVTTLRNLPLLQGDPCVAWISVLAARSPREVWIDGFWVDRHEVTVAEYRACVHAGACALAPLVDGDPRHLADRLPQVNITRAEADGLCRWRGGRLPTEAEWEKAARGTDVRTWPWGDDRRDDDWNHGQARIPALAELDFVQRQTPDNVRSLGDPDDRDGHALAAPPGTYPASDGPHRTADQAGNVAEWVADAMSLDGFLGLADANPLRLPDVGRELAMVRGGSWRDPTFAGRTDLPHYLSVFIPPDLRATHVGFRCVYTTTVPTGTAAPPPRP